MSASTEPQIDTKYLDKIVTYGFDDPWADIRVAYQLGFAHSGGTDPGEVFAVLNRLEGPHDSEGWRREFEAVAAQLEARAEESEKGGHLVSARDAYMRASQYLQAALMFIDPRADRGFRDTVSKRRELFRKAAAMFDPPIERFDVPFDGATLPGYFVRGEGTDPGVPAKTLINIGGGDTIVEELYHLLGEQAARRGYHVVMVDLPGQGATPLDGYRWQPDTEVPLQAIFDQAAAHPDVDATRIAAMGHSGGGYAVPRAAAGGVPFAAIVANEMILDLARMFQLTPQNLQQHGLIQGTEAGEKLVDEWSWKWGVNSLEELLDYAQLFRLDPADIACPTLLTRPEEFHGAYPVVQEFERVAVERINHSQVTVAELPSSLGAGNHCGFANLNETARSIFDWLDEILDT